MGWDRILLTGQDGTGIKKKKKVTGLDGTEKIWTGLEMMTLSWDGMGQEHFGQDRTEVVWRYLLNVYPDGLTGQERMDYMKRKTREYEQLKGEWSQRASPEDLEFIRGNMLKDVLRTDRTHPYYAGSEDSPHLTDLTDLLTTYAVTHPQVTDTHAQTTDKRTHTDTRE
ncbi:UNVERIFIED_CONTAM: hypothetical protein FKN15_042379 [Acipenser sinensis]